MKQKAFTLQNTDRYRGNPPNAPQHWYAADSYKVWRAVRWAATTRFEPVGEYQVVKSFMVLSSNGKIIARLAINVSSILTGTTNMCILSECGIKVVHSVWN